MKALKHLKVVLTHKSFVFYYACKLGQPYRGFMHDFKKFTPTEFIRSSRYFLGTKTPTYAERCDNDGFSMISVHHSNRNFHHWQAWVDYSRAGFVIHRIPYKYAIEYVSDILAATRTYNGKKFTFQMTLDYFCEHSPNYLMHPATKEFITQMVTKIRDDGLKQANKRYSKELYQKISAKYEENIKISFNKFSLEMLDMRKEEKEK